MTDSRESFDAVVVGGGAAGLSAALALGREAPGARRLVRRAAQRSGARRPQRVHARRA